MRQVARALAIAAGLWAGAAGAETGPLLAPEGPLPLDPGRAAEIFEQCSRGAPTPTGPLWTPTEEEIAALERDLEQSFAAEFRAGLPEGRFYDRYRAEAYRGQYAGFEDGGRRLIYAAYSGADVSPGPPGSPMIVCDGGYAFWGVVYDPETGLFSDFAVNGDS